MNQILESKLASIVFMARLVLSHDLPHDREALKRMLNDKDVIDWLNSGDEA